MIPSIFQKILLPMKPQSCRLAPSNSHIKYEGGNVLFIILIAVALFAALSFAVTQSMRSSGGKNSNASSEKNQLLVDQLSQYSSMVSTAVTRIILNNSCSLNTINFGTPLWQDNTAYDLGNLTPPTKVCDVFNINGGGVIFQAPPFEALNVSGKEYGFTGHIALTDVGTAANELLMVVEVNKDICIRANEQDRVTSGGANPPVLGNAASRFETPLPANKAFGRYDIDNGNNRFPAGFSLGDSSTPEFKGHKMGCYETNTGSGIYVFFQVVIER